MKKAPKKRLDHKVAELYPDISKRQIQSWIMQGAVLVNDAPITKAGTMIADDAVIRVTAKQMQYVSRAGYKLAAALDHFAIDVSGLVALDAGLSTGGFADCLLQRGIARVYGVDVGRAQVHNKIETDPRVVVMEQTNLRHLQSLPELVDIVTLDLSFISLTKVLDAVVKLLKPDGKIVALIKPQFEASPADIGKGGIVTDSAVHERVLSTVTHAFEDYGFKTVGIIPSPMKGAEGNQEYLYYGIKTLE